MALNDLTTASMLSITEPWVTPGPVHSLLLSLPLIAPMIPAFEVVHQGLLETQRTHDTPGEMRLRQLDEQTRQLDYLHDRKARGVYGLLTALSELSEDPVYARHFLDLRDILFPSGLEVTDLSYLEEAIQARQLEARLSPDLRQALAEVPAAGPPIVPVEGEPAPHPTPSTLLSHVERLIDAGQRLGQSEAERMALEERLLNEGKRSAPADVLKARHAWVRAVKALVSLLQVEHLSALQRRQILGALDLAEAQASRARQGVEL
jgi:hypothetical protein